MRFISSPIESLKLANNQLLVLGKIMGKTNLYGAVFKDRPEWKNDGVIHVENEELFSSLLRSGEALPSPKKSTKRQHKPLSKQQLLLQEMVS